RGEQIFGHGAAGAHGPRQHIGGFGFAEARYIAARIAIDAEGQRPHDMIAGSHPDPAWRESGGHPAHFTLEEFDQAFVPPVWRRPIERALAGAAPIKRQHQSGIVLAATEAGIPSQAEGAVPAMEETGADLDEVAGR